MEGVQPTFRQQARALTAGLMIRRRRQWVGTLLQVAVVPIVVVCMVGGLQLLLNHLLPDTKGELLDATSDLYEEQYGLRHSWVVVSPEATQRPRVGSRNAEGAGSGLLDLTPGASYNFPPVLTVPYWTRHDEYANDTGGLNHALFAAEGEAGTLEDAGDSLNVTRVMPLGVLHVHDLDLEASPPRMDYTLQYGDNEMAADSSFGYLLWTYSDYERYGRVMAQLTTAAMRWLTKDNATSIHVTYAQLPQYSLGSQLQVSLVISDFLFPLALGILAPSFVYTLVADKALKYRYLMLASGLRMDAYWAVLGAWHLTLQLLATALFLLTCVAWQLPMVTQTEPLVFILLFVLWACACVAFTVTAAACFSGPRAAVITSYVVLLATVLAATPLNTSVWHSAPMPPILLLWPPLALCRGVFVLNRALLAGSHLTLGALGHGHEMATVLAMLAVDTLVFGALGFYLDQVLPGANQVRRPLLFPLHALAGAWRARTVSRAAPGDPERAPLLAHTPLIAAHAINTAAPDDPRADAVDAHEGDDVIAERTRARAAVDLAATHPASAPLLVISDLGKYFGDLAAVNGLSLAADRGDCLALLGPNGSGKSTTIGVATGLHPPSAGDVRVGGYSVRSHMAQVRRRLGVCPQHCILWPNMSCREHLLLYSRLRGVPAHEEDARVAELLEGVGLAPHAEKLASALSGGMRRRLSIAMAMCGDVEVVVLDEPTTGVDPDTRRELWRVITQLRQSRCVLLTSHAMEEVEALANRVAIISRGRLQCVGDQFDLKARFAAGYGLTVQAQRGRVPQALAFVSRAVPSAEHKRTVGHTLHFVFPRATMPLSRVFESLSQGQDQDAGIDGWSVSAATLDEVFRNIVQRDEAAAQSQGE